MDYKVVSTTVNTNLYLEMKRHNIKFNNALRTGATFILSKKLEKYQNKTQLQRQIEERRHELVSLLNSLLDLKLMIEVQNGSNK